MPQREAYRKGRRYLVGLATNSKDTTLKKVLGTTHQLTLDLGLPAAQNRVHKTAVPVQVTAL
jgi:hypothetical protein